MKNAFEILGIKPCLVLSDEALREAFREAGKLAHPDAGGDDGEFAVLAAAMEILASPSRRLKHWLELRGNPADVRGAVDGPMMDLFAEVGALTQQADALIRKRDAAKSALGLALLEAETQANREAVEQMIQRIESSIQRECAVFPEMENAADCELAAASRIARNLAFLEKWRMGLRSLFPRLV